MVGSPRAVISTEIWKNNRSITSVLEYANGARCVISRVDLEKLWDFRETLEIYGDDEQDPSKRYKMGMYQQRPTADAPQETPTMDRQERNALHKVLFDKIRDHHGMYAAFSPDGIHWRLDDRNYVPRSGDAGALVYDPMRRRYLATSRRYETLMDHFVLTSAIRPSVLPPSLRWTASQLVGRKCWRASCAKNWGFI